MKRIIVFCIGVLLLMPLCAQKRVKTDAMLFGHVQDAKTGEHLPYVTLIVKGTRLGTSTDATGHYKLANLPIGKCIIVFQAVGYKTLEKEVFMEKSKGQALYVDMEEDIFDLDQVVVTGTRTYHHLKNVPIRTEVVNSREIEDKNAVNIYQALEGVPGVRVEQQCQFCNFSMVRMQGLGAEHTRVLINGQPMYSGLAGVYGLQQMSTSDIDRIEVVKGAGSALYGSSAVAGAINIVTKEPSFIPYTKIGVQFGSYGTHIYDVNSSMRNERGNIGLSLFAQRQTADAIDQTQDGESRSEVRHKDGISDKVETRLNNMGFNLFFYNPFSDADEKLVIRGMASSERRAGGDLREDIFRNPFTEGTESITTERYTAELDYNVALSEHSSLNFTASYVNHRRNATNDAFLNSYRETHTDNRYGKFAPHDTLPDIAEMRPYIAKENSFNAAFSYTLKLENHSLITGGQLYTDRLKESGKYVITDTAMKDYYGTAYTSYSKKTADEYGFFIQDEWAVTPKLMVVPGIRFDIHRSKEKYTADRKVDITSAFPEVKFDEKTFNPRLAIKYEVSSGFSVRANFGTGFRAPYGFSEDLHLCSGSPRVWKSSALKPEKSMSFNISGDYYGKNFRLSLNGFRTNLKNKIGFSDADDAVRANGYTYQWENIDDAHVQGIEFSSMVNIVSNLRLDADFTCNQGKYKNIRKDWEGTSFEKDSRQISRFPATTGNIKLEYVPKTWRFILIGNYQGRMYIDYMKDDEEPAKIKKTPGFILFNAKIARTIGGFNIYAGINNIFDYVQDEKHTDDAAFMYAPMYGRMFYGGMSLKINH